MYTLTQKPGYNIIPAEDEEGCAIQQRPVRTIPRTLTRLLTALSICLNILFLLMLGRYGLHYIGTKDYDSVQALYSPARQAVQYRIESIDTHPSQFLYGSPPGEAFDRAWSDLLSPTSIWVTPEELQKAGKKSLKVRGEGLYVGYLEVYHQLHCIKRMVQYRAPERYPDLVSRGKLSEWHFNHCIEVLRKGVMCNGDASLNTWTRKANYTERVGVTDYPKKCVNWEILDRWARSRATGVHVDLLEANEDGFLGP